MYAIWRCKYPPKKMTKVPTTERNRLHNLKIQINEIIMGITSKGSNTTEPITNTNPPYVATPPRVLILATDDDDLMSLSVRA